VSGNDVFEWLYDNLEDAYQSGEDYIKQKAQAVADSVTASVEWIWEALQGDFNEDMTTGQIAANAVLGLIPIVDQILDCRDVVANCRQINKDKTDTWAWVALCLTLIGLIPTLGSAVKGVLKILFLYLRKAGGDVAKVITPALRPIFAFLSDPKVKKILGNKGPKEVLLEVSIKLNELAGSINTQQLLGLFDQAIQAYRSVASKIGRIAPNSVQTWLRDSNKILQEVRDSADEMIESVVGMVQDTLKKSADEIKHQADELDDAYKALPDGKVVHELDSSVTAINPKIIKMTNAEKGLYGEILSDNLMINNGFKNLLPEDRQIRKMTDTPRGRGIDGIYENTNPPPPYVVTETKYRTASGKYIDDDGIAKDTVLSTTKGSPGMPAAKQMSDDWIKPRIKDELGSRGARDIVESGYERWLMIVDSSGKVVNITKLDSAAKSIEEVIL
jgi:PAS domain-containing protein